MVQYPYMHVLVDEETQWEVIGDTTTCLIIRQTGRESYTL